MVAHSKMRISAPLARYGASESWRCSLALLHLVRGQLRLER